MCCASHPLCIKHKNPTVAKSIHPLRLFHALLILSSHYHLVVQILVLRFLSLPACNQLACAHASCDKLLWLICLGGDRRVCNAIQYKRLKHTQKSGTTNALVSFVVGLGKQTIDDDVGWLVDSVANASIDRAQASRSQCHRAFVCRILNITHIIYRIDTYTSCGCV